MSSKIQFPYVVGSWLNFETCSLGLITCLLSGERGKK